MSKVFVTTISLVVCADSVGEACDGIAETLRELTHPEGQFPFVLDWGYLHLRGGEPHFAERADLDANTYTEGDFLRVPESYGNLIVTTPYERPEGPLHVIDQMSNRLAYCLDLWEMPEEASAMIQGEINYAQQTLADHRYEPEG